MEIFGIELQISTIGRPELWLQNQRRNKSSFYVVVIEQESGYNLIKKVGLFGKKIPNFFLSSWFYILLCKGAQGQLQRSSPVAIQFILPEAEIILTLILLLITFLKKCCNLFSYNNYKLSTDIEYFFCTIMNWKVYFGNFGPYAVKQNGAPIASNIYWEWATGHF